MDIRCRKTTCKYNKKHTCFAKEIHVTDGVICSTYNKDNQIKEDNKAEDISKTMMQKPPKESPHRDRKTIKLSCSANCLFNKDSKCNANGITVNDLGEPYCMGYLKK